jgi:unsaturated rhamnogalacturonyl hydrolase
MSCTAMFTYALVTGLKNGWLSGDKYVTAAKNGWTALGSKTDSTGILSQVCPGTGQAYGSSGVGTDLKSQQDFYINLQKSFAAGDQHGQAPLLWSAIALLGTDCPGVR